MSDACIFLVIKGFFSTFRNKLTICILCHLLFLVVHPLHSFTCDFPFEKKTPNCITAWFSKKCFSRNFGGFRETSTPFLWIEKKIMKQLKEKREGEDLYLKRELSLKKKIGCQTLFCGEPGSAFDLQPPFPPPITYFVNFTLFQQQNIIPPSYLLPHCHILYSSFIHISR